MSAPGLSTSAKPITLGFISASGTGTVNHYISLRARNDEQLNEDRGDFGIADDRHIHVRKPRLLQNLSWLQNRLTSEIT